MERPENLKRHTAIAITLIILFHAVGLAGFLIRPLRPVFLQIVPYHLLLMTGIVILSHKSFSPGFFLFIFIVFVAGYTAEWLGVHTGEIFGNYAYGDTLGLKFYGVPLTIGVNWFLLIYSTGVLLQKSRLKNAWIRVIAGAVVLVLLDLLIEPVAIRFNYWHWVGNYVPLKNYICWFLLSGLLLTVFEQFKFRLQTMVAPTLLITQFIFFAVLIMSQL